MDPLRSDVEQSVQESQAKFDKMASSLRTAHEIDEANAEGVDNAIKLKIDIDAAVEAARERVQSMDNNQNGVDRRAEEVFFYFFFTFFKKNLISGFLPMTF